MKIIIVGSGVAGSEAGTWLGHRARTPLEIIEIECEPARQFGGWGFQRFPLRETTNLAVRKMYLGREPEEILNWIQDPENRAAWPEALRDLTVHPDRPVPRPLIQQYVTWRRAQVQNPLVTYRRITGEAVRVELETEEAVAVTLKSGERITAERLIMASGSIAVKVPDYLEDLRDHPDVIIDPLTPDGHQHRQNIPTDARVLILGTGLTGEEQANILVQSGHTRLTLLSRNGYRHFVYRQNQANAPLTLDEPPGFLDADTPEEFDEALGDFFQHFLEQGHSHEDILAAVRPWWDAMRRQLGGCYRAADALRRFRRSLAVNSIGATYETATRLSEAESDGRLTVLRGQIQEIQHRDGAFQIQYQNTDTPDAIQHLTFDVIINAVGRNIIRHPIWERLLDDGLAAKHAGIGVRVSEHGEMIDASGHASERIWVVGMARAGDHALRHGFLGNTAFNVPQVRAHLYDTMDALLGDPCPHHGTRLDEVLYRVERDGIDARLSEGDETPLIWAVSENYPDIAHALITRGATLDAQNARGNTALIRAACEGRLDLTRALIAAGAALDTQNEDGYTALILAKRRGHNAVADTLLDAGADTTPTNRRGRSYQNPGHSPRPPVTGPRDAVLESRILEVIQGV